MLNKNFVRFGGGGDTFLHPTTLVILLLAGVLILVVPRKYALAPFLLGSLLIPISQTLTLADVHFMGYRILLTVAWLRLFLRGPSIRSIHLNVIDRLMIAWGISAVVTFSLLWFNVSAFVNRMGLFYDSLGVYFLVRVLHRSEEDSNRTVKILAAACVVIACGMLTEHFTQVNPFSLVGSQPPDVREGRVRAGGPFAHPIIAGTCAAGFLPLFAGLWWQGKSKVAAAAGALGATVMAVTSTSSTAMLAYAAGVVGLFMWPLRRSLRPMRWGVVMLLVGLHLAMKAPVWALIGRIDVVGGSSSYHRFELVNQTIRHFWDWFLLGQRTTYQWGFNLWDTANTYVETAVTGGFSTLVLFIAIVVFAFKRLGSARKIAKNCEMARLLWALGAALFATAVGFVGIAYYDQAAVIWYSLVALISATTSMVLETVRRSSVSAYDRAAEIEPGGIRHPKAWRTS